MDYTNREIYSVSVGDLNWHHEKGELIVSGTVKISLRGTTGGFGPHIIVGVATAADDGAPITQIETLLLSAALSVLNRVSKATASELASRAASDRADIWDRASSDDSSK